MIWLIICYGAKIFSIFSKGGYEGINYRPKFFDFNAVWKPLPKKIVVPEFQAGIGSSSLSFYFPSQCNSFACSSNSFVASSRHFLTHLRAGLPIYVKGEIFVRPRFHLRYG